MGRDARLPWTFCYSASIPRKAPLYGCRSLSTIDDSERDAFSVDIGVEIEIRGGGHTVTDMGGQGVREVRAEFESSLPESDVPVSLRKLDGRGDVELIQVPDADNGYTAIVRIEDDKGGSDNYEFELRWRR